jgi:hypothetical protein
MGRILPSRFVWIWALCTASTAWAEPSSEEVEEIDECLQLEEAVETRGVRFTIANQCKHSLSCELSWVVQCRGTDTGEARREPGAASAFVPSSSRTSMEAAADMCDGDWSIREVQYHCEASFPIRG